MCSFSRGLNEINGYATRSILAIALASSHPLSWNLALVILPTGREEGVVSKLTLQSTCSSELEYRWFEFHRLLGYSTLFWGTLHGISELVYLMTSHRRFRNLWNIRTDGETLLYWFGFVSLSLLIAQGSVGFLRRRWPRNFRKMHTLLALALLLTAAAHWWPFAMLFLPATAIHGSSIANRYLMPQRHANPAAVLGSAQLASLLGLLLVWTWRESYMMSDASNLYGPFFFPPLSVTLSLLLSIVASYGTTLLLSPQGYLRTTPVGTSTTSSTTALDAASEPLLATVEESLAEEAPVA